MGYWGILIFAPENIGQYDITFIYDFDIERKLCTRVLSSDFWILYYRFWV